jgi:hypothetical protein
MNYFLHVHYFASASSNVTGILECLPKNSPASGKEAGAIYKRVRWQKSYTSQCPKLKRTMMQSLAERQTN